MALMNSPLDGRRSKYYAQRNYNKLISAMDTKYIPRPAAKFVIGQSVKYIQEKAPYLRGESIVISVGGIYGHLYYLAAFSEGYAFQECELMAKKARTIPTTAHKPTTASLWLIAVPVHVTWLEAYTAAVLRKPLPIGSRVHKKVNGKFCSGTYEVISYRGDWRIIDFSGNPLGCRMDNLRLAG